MLKITIKESMSVDYKRGAAFLQKYANKLLARGHDVKNLKYLGSGLNGHAFEMANGKVFKLTYDTTEADASRVIMGKKTTHIANIYDVFKFSKSDAYGIVMERLDQPSKEEKAFWDAMSDLDIIHNAIFEFSGPTQWEKLFPLIKKQLLDPAVMSAGEAKVFLRDIQKYNLPQMIDELYNYGIVFNDFHGDNIMKRGITSVIIDLGYSEIQNSEDIEVVEKKNNSLVAK
jgi:hypothetical protein